MQNICFGVALENGKMGKMGLLTDCWCLMFAEELLKYGELSACIQGKESVRLVFLL